MYQFPTLSDKSFVDVRANGHFHDNTRDIDGSHEIATNQCFMDHKREKTTLSAEIEIFCVNIYLVMLRLGYSYCVFTVVYKCS